MVADALDLRRRSADPRRAMIGGLLADGAAWELIADITRMGEWSPETTSAQWTGGSSGPAPGARFKGTNQMGSKKWRSDCVVTACVPGKRFAFDVKAGPFPVAGWAYEFASTDIGCLVTELWEDHRGALMTWMSPVITGTKDRAGATRKR